MGCFRNLKADSSPHWLPEIITMEECGGDWSTYIEAVYSIFQTDFVLNKPYFRGQRLRLKRHPMSQDKESTFWHITSEGANEAERIPDLRRCERIGWIKPIIENSRDASIKVWSSKRKGETRLSLWLECCEYLVILAQRKDYILPWTAYTVTHTHQKTKLQKRFREAKKTGTAL